MCGSLSPRPVCSLAPAAGTPGPQNALSPSRAPHSPDTWTQAQRRNNAQVNRQDKEMHIHRTNVSTHTFIVENMQDADIKVNYTSIQDYKESVLITYTGKVLQLNACKYVD